MDLNNKTKWGVRATAAAAMIASGSMLFFQKSLDEKRAKQAEVEQRIKDTLTRISQDAEDNKRRIAETEESQLRDLIGQIADGKYGKAEDILRNWEKYFPYFTPDMIPQVQSALMRADDIGDQIMLRGLLSILSDYEIFYKVIDIAALRERAADRNLPSEQRENFIRTLASLSNRASEKEGLRPCSIIAADLRDPDPRRKLDMLRMLSFIPISLQVSSYCDRAVMDELVQALQSPDAKIREYAARALDTVAGCAATLYQGRAIKGSEHFLYFNDSSAKALAIFDRKLVRALVTALFDPEPWVVKSAAGALHQIVKSRTFDGLALLDPQTVDALIGGLTQCHEACAEIIGEILQEDSAGMVFTPDRISSLRQTVRGFEDRLASTDNGEERWNWAVLIHATEPWPEASRPNFLPFTQEVLGDYKAEVEKNFENDRMKLSWPHPLKNQNLRVR